MKKYLCTFLMVVFGTFLCESQSAKQHVFNDQNELLTAAIRRGSASGLMVGEVAEMFTKQFKSNGALQVVATTIQHFKRPDCKRLEVVYTKKEVVTPPGKTDAIFKIQVNYCLDGHPPTPNERE